MRDCRTLQHNALLRDPVRNAATAAVATRASLDPCAAHLLEYPVSTPTEDTRAERVQGVDSADDLHDGPVPARTDPIYSLITRL